MGQANAEHIVVDFFQRDFTFERDYDIIHAWWNAHGSFPPKPEHLPSTGIVIEADREPVCAGFLYQTDSAICVFEFVVSDPNAEKAIRDAALSFLIQAAKEWAKSLGFTLIYSSVKGLKYISRLEKEGFIKADEDQVHMFYEVAK
jgi:hypothetical protein